jgi:hypothetical protein
MIVEQLAHGLINRGLGKYWLASLSVYREPSG